MRSGPGRNPPNGEKLHRSPWGIDYYAHNPPGSKVARKIAKHTGRKWRGEIYHTGDLPTLYAAKHKRQS